MQRHTRHFVRGLVIVLPFALTLLIAAWAAGLIEFTLREILLLVLPDELYIPGLGIVIALVFIYLVGFAARAFAFRRATLILEAYMLRIPLVRLIYSPIKDFLSYFQAADRKLEGPALYRSKELGVTLVGFITQAETAVLPPQIRECGEQIVAFYVPMSYQIGGFMLFVPRSELLPVDLTVEEGLRFVLTAGASIGSAPS